MATLTLSVPDDLLRRVKSTLTRSGNANIKEYLLSVMEAMTMEGEPIDKETEAKLLEGLDSPLLKMTEADWKSLHNRVARHRKPA